MKTLIDAESPLWGIKQSNDVISVTKKILDTTCVKCVRIASYYSDSKVSNSVMDDYLRQGYKVQANLNWKSTGTPSDYPTNNALIRSKGNEFFDYYTKYKHLIPVVAIGNEWDNKNYHSGTIAQYLNELSILTEVGHEYGFMISSAGMTGSGLGRWVYSKMTPAEQKEWKAAGYHLGLNNNYDLMVKYADEFCAGARNIPFDFANTHWYNKDKCAGGYPKALKIYMDACGKTRAINNEFGIKVTSANTNALALFAATIAEMIASGVEIAVLYSGDGKGTNAVRLTDEMYKTLQ